MSLKLLYDFTVLMLLVGAMYYAIYYKDNAHREALEKLSNNKNSELVAKTIKQLKKIDRGFYGTIMIIALFVFISLSDRVNFDARIKRLEVKTGIKASADQKKTENTEDELVTLEVDLLKY